MTTPSSAVDASPFRTERITFTSAGETLVGTLFLPGGEGPYRALVVTGPWKNVKEQVASNYARAMAERGYAALAFDFRGWGESAGRPRSMEDPFAKAEDLDAAANYLAARSDVIAVGGLGVCAGSGYLARAATLGDTMKSLALVAPALPSHATVVAQLGGDAGIAAIQEQARGAQDQYDRTGKEVLELAVAPTPQNTLPGADYYTNPARGLIPEWENTFNPASWASWLAFDAQDAAAGLTQPLFIVTSESAVAPDSVREFIARVPGGVGQAWLDNITQFQFYDQPGPVRLASDAVARHFDSTL